ncbi:MAG: dihydroorotate dehydrogenase-like protein [Lentisphaerae bacterium]|nr:dihydroorotate dehydrogenase-like protein [Lentisphaerota bacterium]
MADLSTSYLGLSLKHPIIVGASPMTGSPDGVARCAAAGAAAVVLPSLFEEQLAQETAALSAALEQSSDWHAEVSQYLSADVALRTAPGSYIELIRESRARVDVPVIASINCVRAEWWQEFAAQVEAAGASALELNVAIMPTWFSMSGAEVEDRYESIVRAARAAVKIPIAVKLPETCSSLPDLLRRLQKAGANGFVLFNRFYMPTIDPDRLAIVTGERFSTPAELSPTLRWVALLSGQIRASLAASRGVHSGLDVVRCLLAGADVVQSVSAVIRQRPGHVETMRQELEAWMKAHDCQRLSDFRGRLSQSRNPETELFSRFQYMKVLSGKG